MSRGTAPTVPLAWDALASSCSECAVGYQDQDGDEVCLPDCATAGLQCANGSSCDVEGGSAKCVCDEGQAGATCTDCQEDLQDNDGDGECAPTCGSAEIACGPHGTCSDADGTAACECAAGYAGDDCSACAAGLQDNDGDGDCQPDCSTANVGCGDHGSCDDASGVAQCDCAEGYTGDDCSTCDPGMQDRDGDGVCHPSCKAATVVCGDHGACDDASGEAQCVCSGGYVGADCSSCDTGQQDHDGDGVCAASCATANVGCGDHGVCDDASGAAQCACDAGYTGDDCSMCGAGMQDQDGDGICFPSCATANLVCGDHGACDDASGQAACSCEAGYAGAQCEICASGMQDNDNDGVCAESCAMAALVCGDFGVCDDASGAAQCACDPGYTGGSCSSCASHYQDNDSDGTCAPACGVGGVTCEPGESCDDASGAAVCGCPAGYSGATCEECAVGYQDDDGNGSCQPECASAPWWDNAYENRVSLELLNSSQGSMASGTHVFGDFNHAALVAQGRSLASGSDVRVVYFDGVNNVELSRLPNGRWNTPSTGLIFDLMAPIGAGQTSHAYWVYYNAPSAVNPPVLANPYPATQANDGSKSLTCASEMGAPFYSGQIRQVGPSLYQMHLYDQTHDGAAYVRVQVTDVATGATLKDTTYGNYGTYQSPGTFDEYISVDSTNFTVSMTSREFSGSVIYLGCEGVGSGAGVTGTTTRSYVRGAINPYPEMGLCGL